MANATNEAERRARKAGKLAEDALDGVKDGAAKVAQSARAAKPKARNLAEDVTEKVSRKVSSAKASLVDRAEDAQEAAGEFFDDAQDALSETGARLTKKLRGAADRTVEEASELTHRVGAKVSSAVDAVRGRSPREIVGDMRDLARRNPGVLMAGAAIAGFALAQFLRGRDRS